MDDASLVHVLNRLDNHLERIERLEKTVDDRIMADAPEPKHDMDGSQSWTDRGRRIDYLENLCEIRLAEIKCLDNLLSPPSCSCGCCENCRMEGRHE